LYVLLDSEQKHYYLLNFAREFFANNIFFFFLASFLNSQIYAGPEGVGTGAIDFTTKKYVGKIDKFLFYLSFLFLID